MVVRVDSFEAWSQFGISGLVIAALLAMIVFLVKEHRLERKEWIIAYQRCMEMINETQKETNEVIRELATAVRIQNERRRSIE